MKKIATRFIWSMILLALLLYGNVGRACNISDLTYLGITGPNLPLGPYTISVRLCVGMGITGATRGGDQRTTSFMFAFWSADPTLAISAFTPASVTGPATTVGAGCAAATAGCTNNGSSLTTPAFLGSTDYVAYVQGGAPCSGTKTYGCVSLACLCGPAQSLCKTHTFTTNVVPDSMRAVGVEGAGNMVAGCYPSPDMKIDFSLVYPLLMGGISTLRTAMGVQVIWNTIREMNVDYFIVERSLDGGAYQVIGQIPATGGGNAKADYTFEDKAPASGSNRYRVVGVTKDGGLQDSRSAEVMYSKADGLGWGAVGPNPTNGMLNLEFYSPVAGMVSLQVYDAAGRCIMRERFDAAEGSNSKQLDLAAFHSGGYFIHLEQGGQKLMRRVVRI